MSTVVAYSIELKEVLNTTPSTLQEVCSQDIFKTMLKVKLSMCFN